MKLELFKTLWGHDGDLPSAIALALDAGFSGVEGPAPIEESHRQEFFRLLSGIPWIAEVATCTPPGEYLPIPHQSVEAHLASLDEGVLRSLPGKPRFITTMAGSDEWDFEDTFRFHAAVLELEQKHGIAISIETHRGRPTFHPWRTRRLLDHLPGLRLTCDFSHWCVVTERLVLDQEQYLLDRCANHVHHIHGRVGYAQGPQVPDPRAPEYAAELTAHERWWDKLWKAMGARGFSAATFTPESGPDGYLHLMPFTQAPVACLWDVNRWLGLRQFERFTNHE
jgi:sugar phosphate isomerase/epimerase